jgi:uncharacterized Fe-S center protein
MSMREVLWVDMQSMSVENSIPHKLTRLFEESGGLAGLSEGMRVALKINTAEDGYEYGLRPVFVRTIAEIVNRFTRVHPTICDGIKLIDYWRKSGGKRSAGKTFLEVARKQGYANDTLGGNFVINGGFSGDEGNLYSCDLSGSMVGGVEVGTAVCRSDALIVLSHVTLHPLFGLSGALLNGGFECIIGHEKTRILKGLNPYPFNGSYPEASELIAFQRRALECLLSVRKSMEDRIFYVNYLWDVTPQPEYFPYSKSPVVDNLGFMASSDPVALDAATFTLLQERWDTRVNQTNLPGFTRDIDFLSVLKVAELLGMGSVAYSIRELS